MTDPGAWTTEQMEEKDVDIILITHEHADHLHVESLKNVIANNPGVTVVTNISVGNILEKEGIPYVKISHGQSEELKNIFIEGFGEKHALMHPKLESVENTGYLINNKLFYPGDAFTNPEKQVEILALPVAGPWMKLSEAIDYAIKIKPKVCFPVHEGMLKQPGSVYRLPPQVLEGEGIQFIALAEGEEVNF